MNTITTITTPCGDSGGCVEAWKRDVFVQLQIRNSQTDSTRSIVRDYIHLTKQFNALLKEFQILKNNFTSESAYYSSITPANDKLAKLEASVSDLKTKLSRSYRDAALSADTFAFTSVLLKDAKQNLDKVTRDHYELEDKCNLLEKKLSLYQQKYTVTNQVAEDQQKKIAALQKKEDELAIANNHLQAQIEALKALIPPAMLEKSLSGGTLAALNSPDVDKKKFSSGRSNLTASTPNVFSPSSYARPSPLSTSPTTINYPKSPASPINTPSPPKFPTPSPPSSVSSSSSSSSSASSVSPPNHAFAAAEAAANAKRNSPDTSFLSSSHTRVPALDTTYDSDPNAANAQDLIAYAMRAHATSVRAREMNSRSNSLVFSPDTIEHAHAPAHANGSVGPSNANGSTLSRSSASVANGHANGHTPAVPAGGTSVSNGIDIASPRNSLSASDQLVSTTYTSLHFVCFMRVCCVFNYFNSFDENQAHMSDHLTRFNSMPNLVSKLSGGYSTRMVLSGRPVEAHQQEANCAAFHVSGDVLASGGGDNCVKVWGTSNLDGVPVYKKSLQEATGSSVLSIQFSPNANLLCGTSTDKNIYVWELIGKDMHTLTDHTDKVTGAAFLEENKLASCSWDKQLKIFDLSTGKSTRSHNMGARMNAMCVGLFSSTLCTGHTDKTVRVFDHRTGSTVHTVEVHSREVTGLCNCPDVPTSILSLSKDNTLKLLDLRALGVSRTFRHSEFKNQRDVNQICFSPDGKFVVAGGEEGKILFWKTSSSTLENVITLGTKTKCVSCVAWNPKRNQLIACHDNFLYLYDGNGISSPLP